MQNRRPILKESMEIEKLSAIFSPAFEKSLTYAFSRIPIPAMVTGIIVTIDIIGIKMKKYSSEMLIPRESATM